MAGPARSEMSEVSHANLRRHDQVYTNNRNSSLATSSTLSPAGTLSPFLQHSAGSELISSPKNAFFPPSRDSFISRPSVSEASHAHSSPSRSSIASEKRQASISAPPRQSQDVRHNAKKHSRHSSSAHHSRRASHDVEHLGGQRSQPVTPHGQSVISEHSTVTYTNDGNTYDHLVRQELQGKAVSLLLFLSFPVAIVSFLIAGWTLICLLLFLLAQPLRLLHSRPSPSSELTCIISPSLRFQLRLIYSSAASEQYSAGMLVVIHLVSPFVSIGVVFAAWVAACFWFFSAILGDPAGKDGHNDGKATVVGVRNWWEGWLCRGLR